MKLSERLKKDHDIPMMVIVEVERLERNLFAFQVVSGMAYLTLIISEVVRWFR